MDHSKKKNGITLSIKESVQQMCHKELGVTNSGITAQQQPISRFVERQKQLKKVLTVTETVKRAFAGNSSGSANHSLCTWIDTQLHQTKAAMQSTFFCREEDIFIRLFIYFY